MESGSLVGTQFVRKRVENLVPFVSAFLWIHLCVKNKVEEAFPTAAIRVSAACRNRPKRCRI